MRFDRERGEGIVFYSGEKPGDWFITAGLGFGGYELKPRRSYRFMHPYVGVGRIFDPRSFGRTWSRRIRIPCWIYDHFKGFHRDEKAEI